MHAKTGLFLAAAVLSVSTSSAWDVEDVLEAVEDKEVLALRKHINRNGGEITEKIKVMTDSVGSRGIVATEELEEGDMVMTVPWDLAIMGNGEKKDEEVSMAELHLFLRVLKELRDTSSKHKKYLKTVPRTFSTGIYFEEDDLKCLSSNSKTHHTHVMKQLERFGAIALEVQESQPQSFAGKKPFTKPELFAAYATVFTRALRTGDDVLLIPFFDMFNHGEVTCKVSFLENAIVVSALKTIPSGTELKISYGNHLTPAMMLVYYGFADESFSNVSSHFNFEVSDRTQALVDAGCSQQSDLVIFRDGSFSKKLVECLVLTVLPQPNRTAYSTLPPSEQNSIIRENRLTALQIYSKHITTILSQYPSSHDSPCDSDVGNIPVIQASNELIREVYLKALQRVDDEVNESGAARVEVKEEGKKKKKKKKRRSVEEEEEDEDRLEERF